MGRESGDGQGGAVAQWVERLEKNILPGRTGRGNSSVGRGLEENRTQD